MPVGGTGPLEVYGKGGCRSSAIVRFDHAGTPRRVVTLMGANEVMPFPPLATAEEIQNRFKDLSIEPPGLDRRKLWLQQLSELMVRIATLRKRQAKSRNYMRVAARLAASVTAVVTALTGGTLLAGVHGAAATALGVVAVILGIGGSALTALRPAESYATSLLLTAQYERLWWAIYSYCSTELVTASEDDFAKAWISFTNHEQDISSTLDPGAATVGSSSVPQDS
jgi:hypothetical protein